MKRIEKMFSCSAIYRMIMILFLSTTCLTANSRYYKLPKGKIVEPHKSEYINGYYKELLKGKTRPKHYVPLYTMKYWRSMFINLSERKRYNLDTTFIKARPYDLSFSMTAIRLIETGGKDHSININKDKSFPYFSVDIGDFQINSKWYLKGQGRKVNRYTTARAVEELLIPDNNFDAAIKNYQYWLKVTKTNYNKSYRRYNGGWSNSYNSIIYEQNVVNIIRVLKEFYK